MAIRLFDSLTREIRELKRPDGYPPISKEHPFGMYCCGPTVYGPVHIGNFRTFIVQDVLRRLLELEFGPDKVKHVRNITDVDDRTIEQARKEKRPLADITKKWTDRFHADCQALNLLPMDPPHVEPKATEHIVEQVEMIDELLAKGLAYVASDGSVYFKIAAFPGYGALSRVKERELKATITAADDDHKDDASDFALWKAYKPEEDGDVKWPGPRGAAEGRPGWHIECSAMSKKYLGETLDLHGGGEDLLFPHHENEIAQSEGCTGHLFSHHWFHTKHLLVDGKKMSKSLGNLYTLDDLIAKDFSPMEVRYALLAGHPRHQLDFTLESLRAARGALQRLNGICSHLALQTFGIHDSALQAHAYEFLSIRPNVSDRFSVFQTAWNALATDLDFPAALAAIFETGNRYFSLVTPKFFAAGEAVEHLTGLRKILFALGFVQSRIPSIVAALAEKRWAARKAKDFRTADALRKELAAAGWAMLDGKDGYKLEPLKKTSP